MPIHLARIWQWGHHLAVRLAGRDPAGGPEGLPAVGGRSRPDPEEQELVDAAQAALREWQTAQARFQEVNGVQDPDLVDHVIYQLEAAERKYVYLLRKVQEIRGQQPRQV
ncbi:MAG: YaaL family protein [Firmicutes bacterium]|nr:YaaL family protein [Bacillota bacterium]